jgi:hypothetical protein
MYGLQLAVVVSTIVITLLSFILALFLTLNFMAKRQKSNLLWSSGMWAFTLGTALEAIFAFGLYSDALGGIYLFVVALTVELLALGSVQLIRSKRAKLAYYGYCTITTLLLVAVLISTNVGNIITTYIVFGVLPLSVVLTSSLIAFPAAIIIALVAAFSYKRARSKKMLSIIAGVIVVSVAGTLYIASFPEFLYFSEFVGILLLWAGFFDAGAFKKSLRQRPRHAPKISGMD